MRTCPPSPSASSSAKKLANAASPSSIPQLGVDRTRRLSLGREVVDATGGERDALLPATAAESATTT